VGGREMSKIYAGIGETEELKLMVSIRDQKIFTLTTEITLLNEQVTDLKNDLSRIKKVTGYFAGNY
jgi:hypothetical protein